VSTRPAAASSALALALSSLACAPIDSESTVTVRPAAGEPSQVIGGEQLTTTDFWADYVQLGPRLLVQVGELRTCVRPLHRPVVRVEHIHRSTRGFVAWDFVLGVLFGGVAGLAFARPNYFGNRLVDGQGRVVYDNTAAWVTGGIFAGMSAILLAAGVVNSIKARDETRYAGAYEVEPGPERPCSEGASQLVADRPLRLILGADELAVEASTDREGRARFSLPREWPGIVPRSGRLPAVLEVGRPGQAGVYEPQVLVFALRVPFGQALGADAHTGRADTREQGPDDLSSRP
jgi:hypothetical protein